MDSHGLLDDETFLDQLANVLLRVHVCDLVDLILVEAHLVLAALHDAGGQALLQPENSWRLLKNVRMTATFRAILWRRHNYENSPPVL